MYKCKAIYEYTLCTKFLFIALCYKIGGFTLLKNVYNFFIINVVLRHFTYRPCLVYLFWEHQPLIHVVPTGTCRQHPTPTP